MLIDASHKEGSPVGVIGEIDPQVLEKLDISAPVAYFETNLNQVLATRNQQEALRYVSPTKFPSSDIDLALVVPEEMAAGDLKAVLADAAGECLTGITLFDVYRGEQLREGVRSLAFRLRFEASDRTLTDEEVAEARLRCIEAAKEIGASLRAPLSEGSAE